jgi:hypothetical protein
MFLLSGASYLVYSMAYLPGLESLRTPLNFAGRVIYIGPPILLAAFTRQVFHPADPRAAWLVYGIAVLIIGGIGGSVLGGLFDQQPRVLGRVGGIHHSLWLGRLGGVRPIPSSAATCASGVL